MTDIANIVNAFDKIALRKKKCGIDHNPRIDYTLGLLHGPSEYKDIETHKVRGKCIFCNKPYQRKLTKKEKEDYIRFFSKTDKIHIASGSDYHILNA